MKPIEHPPLNPDPLLNAIRGVVSSGIDRDDVLLAVAEVLRSEVRHYDWVGFYIVDPKTNRDLVLGPYAGAATDHVRIPFGRGICGQAAEKKKTIVVGDVSKETNYLSCSIAVKAEIVVPIVKGGEVVAELDVDSHSVDPFTEQDRQFLSDVCNALSLIF